ncbi:MAG: heavy metal-binding domain-containing protein, partial [Azonexus sp.]
TLGIEFRTRELTETALREEQSTVQAWSEVNKYRQQLSKKIPIATTTFIPGHEISEVIGIVTGESAFAIEASLTDLVFTTNGFADLKLNQAIHHALELLRYNACAIQADAVIGVSIDTSGANKNIKTGVFIAIAVGTAVKLTCTNTATPNS